MILDDWNDAGVVCLDSRNGIVIWMDACELERLVANVAPVKSDTYEDFPAWVVSRLEVEKEEAQYD